MTIPVGLVYAQTPASGSGSALVSDGAAMSDRVVVSMSEVDAAPDGMVYEGWLVSDDGSDALSIGIVSVSPTGNVNHTFTSEDGENLIGSRNKFVISVEPEDDADPAPSDDKPYFDEVPIDAMTHIRHLVESWPAGADNGILTNLKMQLDAAMTHAELARNSATIDDLRQHTQHVINIVEGEDGDNFDASAGNPGDGVGILAHAQDRKHAGFAAASAPGDATVKMHAEEVEAAGANAEAWSGQARDGALDVLSVGSLSNAKTLLNTLVIGKLDAARNGIDATGDGGASQAYTSAQMMGKYSIPSQRSGGSAPVSTGSSGLGLPAVGDSSVPVTAQLAFLFGMGLLAAGVLLFVRDRRSRKGI
jgi:hypothetical protein